MLHGMEEHAQLSKISNLTLSEHFVFFPFSFALHTGKTAKEVVKIGLFCQNHRRNKLEKELGFMDRWKGFLKPQAHFSNLTPFQS